MTEPERVFSKKSLVRAAAELLVICAGVILALIVDDWRQDVEDRERETALLEAVLLDLAADSGTIAREVQGLPTTVAALRTLRDFDPDDLPAGDSLSRVVAATMRYVPNRFHNTAFNALEQSGELRLIDDTGVLRELSAYYKEHIGFAVDQISIARAIHDRWIFEVIGDYGGLTTGVPNERPIAEGLVANPAAMSAWLRSPSGMVSLQEIGLVRVGEEFTKLEAARARLSKSLRSYLER